VRGTVETPIVQSKPEAVFASAKQRMEYVRALRERVHLEKERVKALHRSGASGKRVTRLLTRFGDEIVKDMALVAIGGYGRGELCPYSDVDILFLVRSSPKSFKGMINDVLTLLWDTGYEVGHSVRTIADCLRVAKKDLSARTAMLEGRFLTGSLKLFSEFEVIFRKQVIEKAVDSFIHQKIEGRDRRHKRYEDLVTLIEPNVKEGVGGLRDYHLALWASMARFGFSTIEECYSADLIDEELYEATRGAYDFITRVRNELHYLEGAKDDVLAVEVQRQVAENLGYEDLGPRLAVERFMQDYYHQAFKIRQFSEAMLALCQPTKKGLTKVLERVKSKALGDSFVATKGELFMRQGALESGGLEPPSMLEVFVLCQEHNLVPHESLRSIIRYNLDKIDEGRRREPSIRKGFFKILNRDGAARVLRLMHEAGLLGALIPEFEELSFLPQYDVFHRYTADEHTLKAVQYVEELGDAAAQSFRDLGAIYRGLRSPAVIKMALLLHDIGKSGGAAGHVERGVDIARAVLERWPMGEKASRQILLLAANHLIMNRTAQRRDMHDEKIIREFCDVVGSLENLQLLYLLTFSDLKAVGPEVWTEWKGALLLELYQRAKDYLTREPEERLTGLALVEALRETVAREMASDVSEEAIEAYFQAMPYKYIASTFPERISQHIRLAEKMVTQDGLALEHRHNNQFDYTEVLVCTTGRTGIFSEISKNLNILGAQVYTRRDNIAIDTLQVEMLEGGCVTDDKVWREVEKNLRAIVGGAETVEALLKARTRYVTEKRAVGPPVEAKVAINNRISDTHTVIEMKAHDRLGLLYLVTRTLASFNLDIYLAKISTEGNRAVNVFYVTDLEEEKIFDTELIEQIRGALLDVLKKGEIG
jgi:[protein-PII] uridylyltransferase